VRLSVDPFPGLAVIESCLVGSHVGFNITDGGIHKSTVCTLIWAKTKD
jgi:hypothetical protein